MLLPAKCAPAAARSRAGRPGRPSRRGSTCATAGSRRDYVARSRAPVRSAPGRSRSRRRNPSASFAYRGGPSSRGTGACSRSPSRRGTRALRSQTSSGAAAEGDRQFVGAAPKGGRLGELLPHEARRLVAGAADPVLGTLEGGEAGGLTNAGSAARVVLRRRRRGWLRSCDSSAVSATTTSAGVRAQPQRLLLAPPDSGCTGSPRTTSQIPNSAISARVAREPRDPQRTEAQVVRTRPSACDNEPSVADESRSTSAPSPCWATQRRRIRSVDVVLDVEEIERRRRCRRCHREMVIAICGSYVLQMRSSRDRDDGRRWSVRPRLPPRSRQRPARRGRGHLDVAADGNVGRGVCRRRHRHRHDARGHRADLGTVRRGGPSPLGSGRSVGRGAVRDAGCSGGIVRWQRRGAPAGRSNG